MELPYRYGSAAMMEQESSNNDEEWTFREEDVEISNIVLGRGAFGEVKVARWRGIDVAAKFLHDLADDGGRAAEDRDEDALRREMLMLSKLRHPNLVLFLGVCIASVPSPSDEKRISTILTELMPCSLYQVLEDNDNKRMDLPELLDVATDVAAGLDYLHSHMPAIVHRDISSKNILLGGNRAKIADLGQAKIFGGSSSALSRQTSLPGAMAYSAPEVLTGKYSEKIDIFSFGVLLAQMGSGEYPRIDKREEQMFRATTNHACLESLITKSMAYQPDERPSSRDMYAALEQLMENDRYYPAARRRGPQRDVGLLGRRWMDSELHTRTKDVKTALEQTARRLTAESERLRDEVKRADENEKQALFMDEQNDELERKLAMHGQSNSELKETLAKEGTRANQAEGKVAGYVAELEECTVAIEDMQAEARDRAAQMVALDDERMGLEEKVKKVRADLSTCKEELRLKTTALERSQHQFKLKDGECEDLEGRLEMTLERWKSEKLDRYKETERCSRLTASGATMQQTKETLEAELAALEKRLHMYDELPLPEEIKQRFTDMENDLEEITGACEGLSVQNGALEERNADLDNARTALLEELQASAKDVHERDLELLSLRGELRLSGKNVEGLEQEVAAQRATVEDRDMTIGEGKRDLAALQEDMEAAQFEITSLKETLEVLKKKAEGRPAVVEDASSVNDGEGEGPLADASSPGGEENATVSEGRAPGPGLGKPLTTSDGRALDVFKKGLARPDFSAEDAAGVNAVAALSEDRQETKKGDKEETEEEKRKGDRTAKLMVQHAIDRNGVLALTKLLSNQENIANYHVVWRTTRAVRDMVVKDDAAKQAVLGRGLDELVLAAMASCPASCIAQAQCLRLLGVLAYGSDIVRRRVGERGGLNLLLAAMDRFTHDETLQLHGFTALTNLAHNSIDNRSRFQEIRGIGVVVSVMARHVEAMKVQRQACWAILTVAGNDELSRAIVEGGGDRALVNAMMEHRFDPGIQQFGAWALGNLALAGEDVKRRLKIGGVLEVCRIAMETHAEDPEVLRQARNTVGVLGPGGPGVNSIPPKENFKR